MSRRRRPDMMIIGNGPTFGTFSQNSWEGEDQTPAPFQENSWGGEGVPRGPRRFDPPWGLTAGPRPLPDTDQHLGWKQRHHSVATHTCPEARPCGACQQSAQVM